MVLASSELLGCSVASVSLCSAMPDYVHLDVVRVVDSDMEKAFADMHLHGATLNKYRRRALLIRLISACVYIAGELNRDIVLVYIGQLRCTDPGILNVRRR